MLPWLLPSNMPQRTLGVKQSRGWCSMSVLCCRGCGEGWTRRLLGGGGLRCLHHWALFKQIKSFMKNCSPNWKKIIQEFITLKTERDERCLAVQWLRLCFCCRGSVPGYEAKIPNAGQLGQKKKTKRKNPKHVISHIINLRASSKSCPIETSTILIVLTCQI